MARTGFWFQRARGRAIVRSSSMSQARYWRAVTTRSPEAIREAVVRHGADLSGLWGESRDRLARELAEMYVRSAVERARRAHADWRKYRAMSAELD